MGSAEYPHHRRSHRARRFRCRKRQRRREIADLEGKRVGFVKGNPSVNVKTSAYLAFGGLTPDDAQQVWLGSYSAMKTSLIADLLDAFGSVTSSANMREIEASPRGLH